MTIMMVVVMMMTMMLVMMMVTLPHPTPLHPPVTDHERAVPVSAGQQER